LAYTHDRHFAVSLSGIRTLPHQIEAVYMKMLPQPRLRFLLADENEISMARTLEAMMPSYWISRFPRLDGRTPYLALPLAKTNFGRSPSWTSVAVGTLFAAGNRS
jgi:hypothetical protein